MAPDAHPAAPRTPRTNSTRMRSTRTRPMRVALLLVALLLVLGAPSSGTTGRTTTAKPATTAKPVKTTATRATARTTTARRAAVTPFPRLTTPYAAFLRAVAADLDAWWAKELPARYRIAYRPLRAYYGFTSVSAMPPGCGTTERPRYEELAGNAFYCPDGDFVAFDDEGLFPDMADRYGAGALGVVLAHEMAHAIQVRADVSMPWIHMELQADCFAGAWLKRVASGGSSRVRLPTSTIDEAVLAGLEFSDAAGLGADADGAHGDGFDRVNAIHLGWQSGMARCVTFPTDPPEVTASTYSSMEEQVTSGNVPIDQALAGAAKALDTFWVAADPAFRPVEAAVPTDAAAMAALQERCPRAISLLQGRVLACPADADGGPLVLFDDGRMRQLYRGAGDFGSSTVLALAWSALAQRRTGRPTADQSTGAELGAICTMGAWSGALYRGQVAGAPALSPGDLDEATAVLLLLTWRAAPFERVDRFRDGFDGGMAACR